jgi:hypothetical protein
LCLFIVLVVKETIIRRTMNRCCGCLCALSVFFVMFLVLVIPIGLIDSKLLSNAIYERIPEIGVGGIVTVV